MKKLIRHLVLLLLFALLAPFSALSADQQGENAVHGKARILLVSPGLERLKSFIYLTGHGIIDIPDIDMTVVIYSRARNEFDDIDKFLRGSSYPFIHLRKVDCELDQDDLYRENPCSKIYDELFRNSDAILFLGGDDLPPAAYRQKTSFLTEIENPYRHYFELSFLFHLLGGRQNGSFRPYLEERPDYVVYGFCLGFQTMNVASGGSLYQDIAHDIYGLDYVEDVLKLPDDKRHRNYWSELFPSDELETAQFHRIRFLKDGYFVAQLGMRSDEHPLVCSSHHQAIKDLGSELTAVAYSPDGKIIEAVTHRRFRNVLGVQFHPEFYELYDPDAVKLKHAPGDRNRVSRHDIVKTDESLSFHKEFWSYFSRLFTGKRD